MVPLETFPPQNLCFFIRVKMLALNPRPQTSWLSVLPVLHRCIASKFPDISYIQSGSIVMTFRRKLCSCNYFSNSLVYKATEFAYSSLKYEDFRCLPLHILQLNLCMSHQTLGVAQSCYLRLYSVACD